MLATKRDQLEVFASVTVPERTARRAAEHKYVLELIANGDTVKLFALAKKHGWRGGDLMGAIQHIADAMTLPFG